MRLPSLLCPGVRQTNTAGLGGRPDLQAWLRDRRDAYDALYAELSAAVEGYHFDAGRFAQRFGLDNGQREYLEQRLAPKLNEDRSWLWKAADHDIPVLKQARAEYEKL